MVAQDESFEKAEEELLNDIVDAYVAGFEDALAQVVCKHPGMDTSPFATANHASMDKSCRGLLNKMSFSF